jgi:hypothetical protein
VAAGIESPIKAGTAFAGFSVGAPPHFHQKMETHKEISAAEALLDRRILDWFCVFRLLEFLIAYRLQSRYDCKTERLRSLLPPFAPRTMPCRGRSQESVRLCSAMSLEFPAMHAAFNLVSTPIRAHVRPARNRSRSTHCNG